jgi:hypothetical protein
LQIDIAFLRTVSAKPLAEKRRVLVVLCGLAALTESLGEFHRIAKLAPDDDFAEEVLAFIETQPADERWLDAAFFAAREFGALAPCNVIDESQREEEKCSPYAEEVTNLKTTVALKSDRRKSDLCRVAFRALSAGTTSAILNAHMAEANRMLNRPLPLAELTKLVDWCVTQHVAKRAEAKRHAA